MGWVHVEAAAIVESMPRTLGVAYGEWIATEPVKAGRIESLLSQVLAEWREGLTREGQEKVDEDEATVPLRVVRHVHACVHWYIAVEIDRADDLGGISPRDPPEEEPTQFTIILNAPRDGLQKAVDIALAVLGRMMSGKGPGGTPSFRTWPRRDVVTGEKEKDR